MINSPLLKLFAISLAALSSTMHSAVADVDLVAWWPLDEITDETTPDKSGNQFDIAVQGDMDDDSLTTGKVNGALSFDGFDDMLVLTSDPGADLPISQHAKFTIGLWVRGEFDGQDGDRRVFSEASDSGGSTLFNIGTKNDAADATVDIFLRDGGNATDGHQFSFENGFDGEWHHIALIRDDEVLTEQKTAN
ncbi:MAG: hypothetical protein ACI9R3_003285 [Verrucomicrobiales bacterium]|jgi:hypothetical protein